MTDLTALCADLADEHAALDALVAGLGAAGWATPTPAAGWAVRDQIGHLAYYDGKARLAVTEPGRFSSEAECWSQGDLEREHLAQARDLAAGALLAWWREERTALLRGLSEGVLDAVVSDHRPQSTLQKDCEFQDAEPGALGLSLCFSALLSLVLDGHLPLARAVAALTTGPASVLGLPAPRLEAGKPASFVLVSPEQRWSVDAASLRSKSKNSPLLGRSLPGRIDLTLAHGSVAFDRFAEPAATRRS